MMDLKALLRSAGVLAASFVVAGFLLVACDDSEKKEETAKAPAATEQPAAEATSASTESSTTTETATTTTETTAPTEAAPTETAAVTETATTETAPAASDTTTTETTTTTTETTATTETVAADAAAAGETPAATAGSADTGGTDTGSLTTNLTDAGTAASGDAAATTETTTTTSETTSATETAEAPATTETSAADTAATTTTTETVATTETTATTEPAAEPEATEAAAETTVAATGTAETTEAATTAATETTSEAASAATAVVEATQAAETAESATTTQVAEALGVPLMVLPKLSGELHVLNWQGYGTDEAWATAAFTERTGVKVIHDYFNSEQEMLTKLRTSPGTYDVVLINSSFTGQAIDEKLIQAVDTAKITNYADLSPTLSGAKPFHKDGYGYGIAWVWGVTSFAYNTEVIATKPDSIEALWDPQYAGKVGWRDDAVESVQMAAIATGQDMNNPVDLEKIKEKLKALKPQIKTYWSSEDEWNKAFSAKDYVISVYWSGSAARSKKAFKLPVEFVIPNEGAIGWLDGLSIATGAPNPDAAHAFIDYMVSPEFYVTWDNNVGAPASSNAKAMELLPADALNRAVLNDPAVQQRLVFMAPIPDDRRQQYSELWEEVKTFFTQ